LNMKPYEKLDIACHEYGRLQTKLRKPSAQTLAQIKSIKIRNKGTLKKKNKNKDCNLATDLKK